MGKGERSGAETQAQHVGISPQEDRGGTKGEVGEDTSGEEEIGGVGTTHAIPSERVAPIEKQRSFMMFGRIVEFTPKPEMKDEIVSF